MSEFVADENVPRQILERLREAGYNVATLSEVARTGIRNDQLAELSIKLRRIVLTRDVDFIRLRQPSKRRIKVVYIRLSGDLDDIARRVLNSIKRCLSLLRDHDLVILDEEGVHPV